MKQTFGGLTDPCHSCSYWSSCPIKAMSKKLKQSACLNLGSDRLTLIEKVRDQSYYIPKDLLKSANSLFENRVVVERN